MEIAKLKTNRGHYSEEKAAERSLTAGELIELLSSLDEDTPVIYSNDNGYTYGRIYIDSLETPEDDGDGYDWK